MVRKKPRLGNQAEKILDDKRKTQKNWSMIGQREDEGEKNDEKKTTIRFRYLYKQ